MRFSLILPCLFSLVSASPLEVRATATDSPTAIQKRDAPAPTKGQIAVHGDQLPTPTKGVIAIHGDGLEDMAPWRPVISHYVDDDGKWKGSNSANIVQTKTVTESGKPMTKTESAPVAIVTGEGKKVAVLLTPALFAELADFAASSGCGGKKRAPIHVCLMDALDTLDPKRYQLIERWTEMFHIALEGAGNLMEIAEIDEAVVQGVATTIGGAVLFIIVKKMAEKIANKSDSGMSLLFDFGKPSTKKPPPKENNDSPSPDDEEKCDKDVGTGPEAPFCRDCGGSTKEKKCTTGKWKACPCIFAAVGISIQQPEKWNLPKLWEESDSDKDGLLDDQKPNVTCSNDYGDAIAMEKDYMTQMAKKFCSGDQHEAVLTSVDIKSDQHTDSRVAFKHEPGKGCQATCDQGFEALWNRCEGINSHAVQAQGKAIVKECNATYEYSVTKKPVCDMDKVSIIPANVFQKEPIWKNFCDKENDDNKGHKRSMIVDINGIEPPRLKRDLEARTPPANTESYRDWRFSLSWEPNHQGKHLSSCADAFKEISQSYCGTNGNEQNLMTKEGSLSVGDGTYSYRVNNQWHEIALEKGKKVSWDADKFNNPSKFKIGDAIKYGKKNGKYQDPTWKACGASSSLGDGMTLTPKDHHRSEGMSYVTDRFTFSMFWKKDCKLENGPQKQFTSNPLGDGTVNCADAYRQAAGAVNPDAKEEENYALDKETIGGFQDYGCVRYMITPGSKGWSSLKPEDKSQPM